jgi:hypothetical protein
MNLIRPYDIAKKEVIKNVYNNLLEMKNNYVCCNFYYTGKKFFRSSPRKINYRNNTYQNNTYQNNTYQNNTYQNNTYQNFAGSKSL